MHKSTYLARHIRALGARFRVLQPRADESEIVDVRWVRAVGAQVRGERLDGRRVLALGHEDHSPPCRIRVRIGEERHVLLSLGAGSLIECHPPYFAEISFAERLVHVARAQRHHPVNREPTDARGARKGRLARQKQHECLKQQREAGELARPGRDDLDDFAVGQLHPRHAHRQVALVLEEVQVPVGLRHRVVDRVLPGLPRHGKAAADLEIHPDAERALLLIKAHPGDKPGRADAQGCLEDLLGDHACPFVSVSVETYHSQRNRSPFPDGDVPVGAQARRCARPAPLRAGYKQPAWARLRAMQNGDIRSDLHRLQLRSPTRISIEAATHAVVDAARPTRVPLCGRYLCGGASV